MSLPDPVSNRWMEHPSRKPVLQSVPFLVIALIALLPRTASGGAWTLERGHVWSKLSYMSQSTNEHYDNDGNVGEIPARFEARRLYLDVYYGATERIDVGIQLPYITKEFADVDPGHPFYAVEEKRESGLGDLRGFAKVNLLQHSGFVGTLKFGVKLPFGDYRPVPEALSLTGGQWDFDAVAQIGRSLWPVPAYANLDLGYRLRGEYKDTDDVDPDRSYTPGAEFVFNLEAGYSPMDRLLVALKFEGLAGAEYDAISNPGTPETLSQRVTYLVPTVLVGLHPNLSLEAAARRTMSGRRYFAGSAYTLGISYTGNLIEKLIHQGTAPSSRGE